ncbi:MAG: DUF2313 domain-containing protein [Deltaproteobacteria bacterium]|jgi:uncharacterized protein YmfQ (DUF2313 family)|nr:DUF2313 domain-containing protein [Deltaproteobacteria bacterium]
MSKRRTELPMRVARDYIALLQSLLPLGLAWTRAPGANLTRVLGASAEELARVDLVARLLPDEVNPGATLGALEDWERVLDLPDKCLPAGSSFQERKEAVLAKLRDTGRQDMASLYENAETLGYSVTIEEHWPFICAWHECGDPQGGWTEESGMSLERWEQDEGYPIGRCGPEEIRYWLNVIVHGDRLILFRCAESLCPEPLLDWRGAEALECVIRREKEAHILLTFEYREV